MDLALFISRRITFKSKRSFSRLIVNIAIGGIALGLAVMIIAMGIVTGFKAEIQDKITGFGGHIQISHLDLNKSLEQQAIQTKYEVFNQFNASQGIKHIQAYAIKAGIISAHRNLEGVALKGVGADYDWTYLKNSLVAGTVPVFTDTAISTSILVSDYTANLLNLKLQDKLLMYFVEQPLRKRKFEIVGIYSSGVQELDKLYIIGDINQVRKLNNWTDQQVGGFELQLVDFDRMAERTQYVYEQLPEELIAQSAAELYPELFEWLSLLDVNSEVIIVLMLLVAGINMVSALLIMILERSNMIGMLKALGSSNRLIRSIFIYNATYLIGWGMIVGNIIGITLCWIQQQFHLIKLNQEAYYMAYAPVELKMQHILLLNGGTLVCCLLMLLIPSLLVSRISPIKAIRFK